MTGRWAIAVAVAGALLAACEAEGPANAAIGEPVPAYAAVEMDGDSVTLADLRGDVVLLNVWATWCAPCREEMPELQSLHERYAGQDLRLVGVSIDARGEESKVQRFAEEQGVTYTTWLDPDARVTTTFLAVGVPATYLIARDGTLLWRHVGPVRADDAVLTSLIDRALAASP